MRSLSALFISTAATLSTLTLAQSPVPVCCMAYTSIDEMVLYIQGGLDANRTPINQFIALNLSIPTWHTSAPPWLKLSNLKGSAPPTSSWHSMVAAMDRRNLVLWDPLQLAPMIWSYNINEALWINFTIPFNVTQQPGIRNGVDLIAGGIYVPAGSNNGTQLFRSNFGTSGSPVLDMPAALMPVPIFFESFVWSVYRNTFLHYGGRSMVGNTSNPHLNEYSPESGWGRVNTTGPSPGDVSGHCMIPASGGSKMIVFGGAGLDGIAKANIHILDLATSAWSIGKPADASQARTNMACVVAGDSFIVWGGENAQVTMDAIPLVYDIRNNEWTTQFRRNIVAGAGATAPGTSFGTGTPPNSGDTATNIAAIGGGIAAGTIVGAALVGFVIYRRRRIASRQGMNGEKKKGTIVTLSARDPQNPDGDLKEELLRVFYLASSPAGSSQRTYDDQDEFFRRLAASPLVGPHSFMRDPQGEQPHQPKSGDEDKSVRPNSGSYHQQASSLLSPRSPQMVSRTITTLSNWSSNGDDNNKTDENDDDKSARLPSSLPNAQTAATDGQDRLPRLPQWQQQSLLPVILPDKSWNMETSQELVQMIGAMRTEQVELEKCALVQAALVTQMQVPSRTAPQATLCSRK